MSEYVTETYVANADLSAKQYFMMVNSAGRLCDTAGSGAVVAGVLQNKPESGQHATLIELGKSKVSAGGTITAGQLFMSTAAGAATDVTSGLWIAGRAITGVASGGLFDAQIFPGGYKG